MSMGILYDTIGNEYVSKFESLDILYNRPHLKKNQAYPLHSFTIQGNEKPMLIRWISFFLSLTRLYEGVCFP